MDLTEPSGGSGVREREGLWPVLTVPRITGSVSLAITDFTRDVSADKMCHQKAILLRLCLSEPKLNCGVWMGI